MLSPTNTINKYSVFQWSLENPGSVFAEPFELKPAMFELGAGKATTLEVGV